MNFWIIDYKFQTLPGTFVASVVFSRVGWKACDSSSCEVKDA
jgi:hypothetical protein